MVPLWKGIGSGQINHFAILVQKGRLGSAMQLFTRELGWIENISRRISGEWGEARFVRPPGTPMFTVQLTELAQQDASVLPGDHIALAFEEPDKAASLVKEWAVYLGFPCDVEEVPGGKFFVSLHGIFRTQFEFVPFPR